MLFSQFPPPSTSSLDNAGVHSRPSRLRRFSNLRNYRSAVTGAVSAGTLSRGGSYSANNASSNNTAPSSASAASNNTAAATAAADSSNTRSPPDLHLTRSLTVGNTVSNNTNINQGISPSSSSNSTGTAHTRNKTTGESGDGNPLTQVNSAPNFATTSGAAAKTSESNPTGITGTGNASPVSVSSTHQTDSMQIQLTSGETASISSQSPSDAVLPSVDETSAPDTTPATTANPVATTTTTYTTNTTNTVATATAPVANTLTSAEPAAPSADDQHQQQREDQQQEEPATMTRTRSLTTGDATLATDAAAAAPTPATFLPSIRLSAYYDPRSTRPSLSFPPIMRTLPSGTETIRVGRYSERDSQSMANTPGNQPSSAPVGFKSKVVSRRHCEFWYENGKWYIKDVKSSSGTFLNHIRLSPPSQESKAFPVNDGDIVQLGIDFKGGEEMIFRCVKMRLELNRGWQNKLNTFNVAAHKRLRTMGTDAQGATSGSSDCSICLNSIAPCQSLFVAPCSHTWHFKCVRSLLTSPQYPIFICPNCRAGADLEADVDDPAEGWQDVDMPAPPDDASDSPAEAGSNSADGQTGATAPPVINTPPSSDEHSEPEAGDPMDVTTVNMSASELPQNLGNIPHAVSEPLPIRHTASATGKAGAPLGPNGEGPITPRNNAGPWVFDGRAGQGDATGVQNGMRSLDAAADMDVNQLSSDASSR